MDTGSGRDQEGHGDGCPSWWAREGHQLGSHRQRRLWEGIKHYHRASHTLRKREKKSNVLLIPAGNGSAARRFLHPEEQLSLHRQHFLSFS